MKALLYPHYHAGTLPRERFKAVGRSAYEAAVAAFAGGGGGGAAALCDGGGALREDVAAWLHARGGEPHGGGARAGGSARGC